MAKHEWTDVTCFSHRPSNNNNNNNNKYTARGPCTHIWGETQKRTQSYKHNKDSYFFLIDLVLPVCLVSVVQMFQIFKAKFTMAFRCNLTVTLAMSHKTYKYARAQVPHFWTLYRACVFMSLALRLRITKPNTSSWTVSSSLCGKFFSGSCVAVNIPRRMVSSISRVCFDSCIRLLYSDWPGPWMGAHRISIEGADKGYIGGVGAYSPETFEIWSLITGRTRVLLTGGAGCLSPVPCCVLWAVPARGGPGHAPLGILKITHQMLQSGDTWTWNCFLILGELRIAVFMLTNSNKF